MYTVQPLHSRVFCHHKGLVLGGEQTNLADVIEELIDSSPMSIGCFGEKLLLVEAALDVLHSGAAKLDSATLLGGKKNGQKVFMHHHFN